MTYLDVDFQIRCQQVWLAAWTAVASCENAMDAKTPGAWADQCLRDFRERFDPVSGTMTRIKS